jgi:uncharacterized protein YbjT (DUF2867 family)
MTRISCVKVFLTGATGFVGRNMIPRLLAEGHAVRALVRGRPGERTRLLQGFRHEGDFQYVPGDVITSAGLDQGMQECDAIIHLVGIIVEKGMNTFDAVHHIGTRNVIEAAKRARVKRLVHMSALGVRENGVAEYQRSKWEGEEEVRRSGIVYCILRPSLIFGPGDGFVAQMIDMMKKSPFVRPVPGDGFPKFRPIFVEDVTFCFVRALTEEAAANQTVELGGADELTLNEVLAEIARCAGVKKRVVHIPMPLMFLAARMASMLPNPPVTPDQLRMLQEGSTCDIEPMRQIFGFAPRGFSGCGRN